MKLSKYDMGVGIDYCRDEMKFWLQIILNFIFDLDMSGVKKLEIDILFFLIIILLLFNFFINIMVFRY